MNSRYNQITSFLKQTYELKIKNPNTFNQSTILLRLKAFGLSDDEFQSAYDSGYYSYWLEYYKNNKVIDIFDNTTSDSFKLSSKTFIDNDSHFIRVYINVSKKDYFNVITKIISFFANHPEIETESKISKICQSDQIILKVRSVDDVVEISKYFYNDANLINCLRDPNPFLLRCGKLGLLFDESLSFNRFISYAIDEYFKTNYDMDRINSDDFVSFVHKYYKQITDEQESLEKYELLKNSEYFNLSFAHLKTIDENITIEDAITIQLCMFEQFFGFYHRDDDLNSFEKFYDYFKTNQYKQEREKCVIRKEQLCSAKKVLDSYIKYMYAKHNSIEPIEYAISNFATLKITDPDTAYKYITKEKDFREKFLDITSDHIYKITNNDIFDYIDNIIRDSYI